MIAPGQTGVFRAVNLGLFSSDPRKPESHVPWFEVTYSGWSSIAVSASTAKELEMHLPEARTRLCSIYRGSLTSSAHVLNP